MHVQFLTPRRVSRAARLDDQPRHRLRRLSSQKLILTKQAHRGRRVPKPDNGRRRSWGGLGQAYQIAMQAPAFLGREGKPVPRSVFPKLVIVLHLDVEGGWRLGERAKGFIAQFLNHLPALLGDGSGTEVWGRSGGTNLSSWIVG